MFPKKRVDWIDALKGFAIIWLIIYHFHVFGWLKSPVGVFFFLSGLFFSEGNSFYLFLKKKINALLVPFVFFFFLGIIILFCGSLVLGEKFVFPPIWKLFTLLPISGELRNPIGVGAIWFLIALFDIYLLFYAIIRVSKNKWWVLGISFLCLLLSSFFLQKYHAGSVFFIFNALFFLPFFSVANLCKDFVLRGKFQWWLILLLVFGYITSFINLSSISGTIGGGYFVKDEGFVFWFMSCVFIGLCLSLSYEPFLRENVCLPSVLVVRGEKFIDNTRNSYASSNCCRHRLENDIARRLAILYLLIHFRIDRMQYRGVVV